MRAGRSRTPALIFTSCTQSAFRVRRVLFRRWFAAPASRIVFTKEKLRLQVRVKLSSALVLVEPASRGLCEFFRRIVRTTCLRQLCAARVRF